MKKPNEFSEKDRAILDKLDILLGNPDPTPNELAAELEEFGLQPDELRAAAFQRIRNFAAQKYMSKGMDVPAKMSEALRQLRPPTPEEQEASRLELAKSRVQGILAAIKDAGASAFAVPGAFAPAYRNKDDDTPESDKKLLEDQQTELDRESEQ